MAVKSAAPLYEIKIVLYNTVRKRKGGGLMYCMKCGRETTSEAVFCDSCLKSMAQYPVKPGTAIHLPQHKSGADKKPAPRKRTVSPEEQILALKKTLRRSRVCIVVLLLVLSLASLLLVREFADGDMPVIGQNYTIDINMDRD